MPGSASFSFSRPSSTALPDPLPKRPRRLRRFFLVAAVVALAAGSSALFAVWHLDAIAKWTIHRMFPGVVAEMGSLRLVSATQLEVRKLVLRSTKTHEPLLALENGSAVFSFARVWRAQLESVTLLGPDLAVSPDLGEALGMQSPKSSAATGSSGFPWSIAHVVVSDGRLRIARFGEQSPTVELHFSADFQNFGVGGEAATVEHVAHLDHIAAFDKSGRRLLDIADADLRFTTEELFTRDHLRAARIGDGSITITQSLLDFFEPRPRAKSAATAAVSDAPGWSVGALDLDGMHVLVPDAPGVIGKVEFSVTAVLRDLGAVGTPQSASVQQVVVSDLAVATDRDPGAPLLQADVAEARFTIAGLAQHRIEELSLENPIIDFAPEALTTPMQSSAPSSGNAASGSPPAWLIAHVSCNSGELRLRGLQNGAFDLSTKFSFDMRNLGTQGDAATAMQELTLWDTQASSGSSKAFLTADVARVRFTTAGLLEKKYIDSVKVDGGRLIVGDALQKLLTPASTPKPQQPAAAATGPQWSIGALDISGVRTRIEDKRPGVTDLRFTLNTSLRDVSASGVSSQVFDQVQTIELANIDLNSPIHKGAKILTLRSVFVRFTLRELARKHLTEVTIREPIIYLSEDLFVYMERASASESSATNGSPQSAAAGPSWSVDHLEAKSGKLVIGSGGQKDVGLPLQFETTMDDVALDNLAKLKVQAALRVPRQSYDFPAYQLGVEDVQGDLRFAYPPEKGEKNLVQKLEMKKIRWRQFQSRDAWIAVTFDARGINGLFGGQAYRGYVNGGFSFFFRDDAPWEGWVAGTDVDTSAVTDVMAPQNFRMTGPLDFEVQLDAFRKDISRMRGVFHVKEPGKLHIGKLDDLLANIPPEWPAIKQSSTRIALESLRDFDYTHAAGDFWFVESQGLLDLRLTGPLGSRNFEVALHDDTETQNRWQKGTLGNR
jgi:hypothetical protein